MRSHVINPKLQHPPSDMLGAREMPLLPLVIISNVNKENFPRIQFFPHLFRGHLRNHLACGGKEFLSCHSFPPRFSSTGKGLSSCSPLYYNKMN
jgi:hypothetical protein